MIFFSLWNFANNKDLLMHVFVFVVYLVTMWLGEYLN